LVREGGNHPPLLLVKGVVNRERPGNGPPGPRRSHL